MEHVEPEIQEFTYGPLNKHSIRVIEFLPESTSTDIRCSVVTLPNFFSSSQEPENAWGSYCGDTEQRPKFAALSYCWGDATDTRTITLDDQTFNVTASLWEALSSIWQYHHIQRRYYWIDAICIDQSNIREKSEQVRQMWRIYSSAQVLAWLGPEDEETEAAFDFMQFIDAKTQVPEDEETLAIFNWMEPIDEDSQAEEDWKKVSRLVYVAGVYQPQEMNTVKKLLSRDYFDRTWIHSEFLQAGPELKILCGKYSCSVAVVAHFAWLSSISESGEESAYVPGVALLATRFIGTPNQSRIVQADSVLRSYAGTACADPRDRVFALLNDPRMKALEPQIQLEPDYGLSFEEVALTFAAFYDRIVDVDNVGGLVGGLNDTLGLALGFPKRVADFRAVIKDMFEWPASGEPCEIVLSSGKTIDCSGRLLRAWLGPLLPGYDPLPGYEAAWLEERGIT